FHRRACAFAAARPRRRRSVGGKRRSADAGDPIGGQAGIAPQQLAPRQQCRAARRLLCDVAGQAADRAADAHRAPRRALATLYAATQASHPPPEERTVPARPGWGRILANTWAELDRDHVSIMAAGIAFYALLSIFPGMSALISIYGLAADPAVIERQLNAISGILPQEALTLLSSQLHTLVAAPPGRLGIGLIVSLSITIWSATSGTGVLM